MLALVIKINAPRYIWTKVVSARFPRWSTGPGTLLSLQEVPEPQLPGPSWVRIGTILSGICGSDMAVIRCKGSLYLSAFTSFPFTPGHEVYGDVIETGDQVTGFSPGDRVVIEPALGCVVRGFSEPCTPCAEGRYANCLMVTEGDISGGLQTGFCRSVPGGWGAQMVAHESQLYRVPEALTPEAAVLIEPFSCALHGVLTAGVRKKDRVLVIGCGAIGLLTITALKTLAPGCEIIAMARYPHQQALARELGARHVVSDGTGGYPSLAEVAGAKIRSLDFGKPVVIGGFPVVFECVGTSSALDDATRWASEGGTVVMQGMPSGPKADLAPVWYKQLRLKGSYAYGVEKYRGRKVKTFDLALDFMTKNGLGKSLSGLVRHRFPLHRYREAIDTALRAGRLGGVKTVFDLRNGTPG